MPGIDYILWMTFQLTGIVVWSLVILWVSYLLVVNLLIIGGLNTISFHVWCWKTDSNPRITPAFLWSMLICLFRFYGHRRSDRYQFRALNGAHWRSAFDYSYSFKDRTARAALDRAMGTDNAETEASAING